MGSTLPAASVISTVAPATALPPVSASYSVPATVNCGMAGLALLWQLMQFWPGLWCPSVSGVVVLMHADSGAPSADGAAARSGLGPGFGLGFGSGACARSSGAPPSAATAC